VPQTPPDGERDPPAHTSPSSVSCSACGFANPAQFRFCGGCGATLHPSGADRSVLATRGEPERRQLTVLFCDLVGSSRLANRLDPEELRELIVAYQSACTFVIRRFEGTVARYVGDGILVLFGYPRAHEDDAERAVWCGLELVSTVSALDITARFGQAEGLAVRIGIATGVVVVGDIIGEGAAEELAVLGQTPNLAARMQTLAAPNTVVIAPSTRALVGQRFTFDDLGAQPLAGFADPVRACRVIGPGTSESRFEAAQPSFARLVNREEYTRWLRALWQEASGGRGKVALLSGEPGIGKSRIVQALREQIAGTPYAALHFQCSPYYTNSALHPIIEHIRRAAGIRTEDSAGSKLDRLSVWLSSAPEAPDAVPLLAALLAIPTGARFPMLPMSPQRRKERTFEVLLDLVSRLAATWPLPIVFEDVHWIDPTSMELLTLLVERASDLRVLLVITFRSGFSPPWPQAPHIERREIEKLSREHAADLAEQVAGDRLTQQTIRAVVSKTDGVPLFVEELTKALVGPGDAGAQPRENDRTTPSALAIPSTLQDSLMARLDQLGPAKFTGQVAATIGREFTYELLEAVAQFAPTLVREHLQALEHSGLVHGEPCLDAEQYVFKHALVQEAAYHSLLRSRRRELHMRIAQALEARFPQTVRDTPELIAHHWTEAGVLESAVQAWLAAGRRAAERSEYREAVGHLRTGLALIPRLARPDERVQHELALLLALGPVLITLEGGGTPEVNAVYTRALELCEARPDLEQCFVAEWGWWRISMNHRTGRERADHLLALAQAIGKPEFLVQAHHCQWATLYMLGAHTECCRHVEAGLAAYDVKHGHVHAGLYGGHDARVCALGELALARWMIGKPDAAVESVHAALAWSDTLGHVGSRAHAMDYALVLHKFRRDLRTVHARGRELVAYASEQKLRVHRAKGAFFCAWAEALIHEPAAGLNAMLEAMASEESADTPTDFPLYFEMLAQAYGRAGRIEEALRTVDRAFAVAEQQGIVFWNPELHRRRGELLRAIGERDGAEAAFEEALACAGTFEARALELRAALSLARLHAAHDGPSTARTIVRRLYESYTEGFDTPDLTEARQLLDAKP
jgi:class 3 adenylate cyclase/predicted ATPase